VIFDKKCNLYKAKDTPWDAVLVGSVVCTVAANVQHFTIFLRFFIIFFVFIYNFGASLLG